MKKIRYVEAMRHGGLRPLGCATWENIHDHLERAGFGPSDELAILKLSDLRDLIGERERNDQLCYYVTGEVPAPCATKPS